jgi:Tfp pilus assembly protein PilW
MAKQRKGISKALKKGKVESGFTIDESADDSGFGTPKTKEKSVFDSALEQEDFNRRNAYIDQRGDFSTSDPDPLGRDNAALLEPGSGQKSIHDATNYTAGDARKMDPVYAVAAGLGINQMMRRKDAGTPVYATKDQPTLYNPNAKGLDPKMDKMSTKEAGKVDSKQGSALVGATKKTEENTQAAPEKMDSMPTKEAGSVAPTQGKSLVAAVQQNPVAQVTQHEVLDTGVKDASSLHL